MATEINFLKATLETELGNLSIVYNVWDKTQNFCEYLINRQDKQFSIDISQIKNTNTYAIAYKEPVIWNSKINLVNISHITQVFDAENCKKN